jgi:CO/xanthine dehydrogenase Mo-binding subunit
MATMVTFDRWLAVNYPHATTHERRTYRRVWDAALAAAMAAAKTPSAVPADQDDVVTAVVDMERNGLSRPELARKLMQLSKSELLDLAAKLGIDTEPTMTRQEIAELILDR